MSDVSYTNVLSDDFSYVHLHVHGGYSLFDASIQPKQLAKRMKELGMDTIALTDHGHMFGIMDFYSELKKDNLKLIVGMETYVSPRHNTVKQAGIDDANYHLVLLCENMTGYENLMKIASDASISGFFYKARTDKHKLRKWSEGIIALSACLGGEVQKILSGEDKFLAENITEEERYEKAKKVALEYDEIFGRGNFYLELQNHGIDKQPYVNEKLIQMSKETGIPIVATNDCHYINAEDAAPHDVLMAIQAKTTVDDTKRKVYPTNEFYVKSSKEMIELFRDVPEAITNTRLIADRCNVEFEFGVNKLPPFDIPEEFDGDNEDFLRHLVNEGAKEIYGELRQDQIERIEYEIGVISKMGYINYFLIVWDIFRFCKTGTMNYYDTPSDDWVPIATGPGRGSGAGSIILNALGITKIDPLKFNLMFERFLDPSRVSMPDVDSDFEDGRRQEVIDYVIAKYGRDSVCQIITFGTMAARAAIRLVGKALGLPLTMYDSVSKMVPQRPGITLKEALEESPDLMYRYKSESNVKKLIDTAMALEGLPTHTSTHAGGILVVDKQGLTKHVPLWVNENSVVAQYQMGTLERLGLLKIDLLGLKTLGVLTEAVDNVEKNHGVRIDLNELSKMEDLAPLKIIADGKTSGIFQLEGDGMTKFMSELKPKNIEEIIAGISLYRPGPMGEIPKYLAGKRNPESVEYPFPALEPILKETYGVLCYQEQCMRAVVEVAGYDKSDADSFRKVIAKKQKKLIPLHRKWFVHGRKKVDLDEEGRMVEYPHAIPGGVAKGNDEAALNKFFDLMEDFGSYAFNKSHATAYAVVGYETAYLLYYYPVEFLTALLNSVVGDDTRVSKYINFAKKDLGIIVEPPNINTSSDRFVPTKDGRILCSLNVKTASTSVLKELLKERDKNGAYSDFQDFIYRTYDIIDKSTLEALISAGAFNTLGLNKASTLAGLADIMKRISSVKNSVRNATAKGKTYDTVKRLDVSEFLPNINDFPLIPSLNLEKKYVGIYLSGHPLNKYAGVAKTLDNCDLSMMEYSIDENTGDIILDPRLRPNMQVRFVGIVTDIRTTVTRKTKQPMAFAKFESMTGVTEVAFFPEMYAQVRNILKVNEIYKVAGRTNIDSSGTYAPSISCLGIDIIEDIITERAIIELNAPEDVTDLMIKIKNDPMVQGKTPLYVEYNGVRFLAKKSYWVNANKATNLLSEYKIKITKW